MAGFKIRLDSRGMTEMLSSAKVADATLSAAEAIAANVDAVAHDGPVEVWTGNYVTDRAAASVTMAHPGALGIEAVYGPLASAAASAGYPVKGASS